MLFKFMGWVAVLAAVAILGWQAHDWISPPMPPVAAPQKAQTVYVPVQAPDDPFRGFVSSSSHSIQEQQQGCYDVRDTCAGH